MTAADRIRAYHERTKHSVESILRNRHYLDWDNEPSRFKEYLDLEPDPLPAVEPTGVPWFPAVRGSATGEGSADVDLGGLSHLLFHAAGVSRTVRGRFGEFRFRTYACAGALYPIEAYVVAGGVEGLDPGVYHYAPREHGLRRLRQGKFRGNLSLGGEAAGAATVVLAGIPWRTAWKYTARGFRHLYWDSGMMLANLLGAAAARGIRTRVVLGLVQAPVDELLGLDGRTEFALVAVALGSGDDASPAEVPSLSPRVAPVSPRPQEDPAIREAHEAVSLRSEDEVRAFRDVVEPTEPEPGRVVRVGPLEDGDMSGDGFEAVVRRRGSSRRLARRPFPAAEYAAILDLSLSGFSADWSGGLVRPLLVASGLEGLTPGAFAYEGRGRFRLIDQGDFRNRAGHLCLDQRLGADAAATTFLMADLDAYLGALGARGYAAAQIEAAVAAGRMYLGAYAQRLGASGITFYDDEARAFFGTDAEPMLAVVMGPEGHRRLGR